MKESGCAGLELSLNRLNLYAGTARGPEETVISTPAEEIIRSWDPDMKSFMPLMNLNLRPPRTTNNRKNYFSSAFNAFTLAGSFAPHVDILLCALREVSRQNSQCHRTT